MILSTAMMFDWLGDRHKDSLLQTAGADIKTAVDAVLSAGKIATPDMGGSSSTEDFGNAVVEMLC
jgi:3-isopropylmalate dehydrogenase